MQKNGYYAVAFIVIVSALLFFINLTKEKSFDEREVLHAFPAKATLISYPSKEKTTFEKVLASKSTPPKRIILHYWATWCGTCLEEMPQFLEYARKREQEGSRDYFFLLSIRDSPKNLRKYLKDFEFPGNVGVFQDELPTLYEMGHEHVPYTVFYNEQLNYVDSHGGLYDW